jgi:hypothetical protein
MKNEMGIVYNGKARRRNVYTNKIFIHSSMALQPFVEPWPLLQFHNLFFYTDVWTPWTSDQTLARPLPAHRTTQTQNKSTQRHPCLVWDSNPRSGNPEGKRLIWRRSHGWELMLKLILKKQGLRTKSADWIYLAQEKVHAMVASCKNYNIFRIP